MLKHVLSMFWACFEHVLSMCWACWCMFWACRSMCWACCSQKRASGEHVGAKSAQSSRLYASLGEARIGQGWPELERPTRFLLCKCESILISSTLSIYGATLVALIKKSRSERSSEYTEACVEHVSSMLWAACLVFSLSFSLSLSVCMCVDGCVWMYSYERKWVLLLELWPG